MGIIIPYRVALKITDSLGGGGGERAGTKYRAGTSGLKKTTIYVSLDYNILIMYVTHFEHEKHYK